MTGELALRVQKDPALNRSGRDTSYNTGGGLAVKR